MILKIRRGHLKPPLAPEIVAVLEKSEHNDNFLYGSVTDAVQSTTAAKKSVATLLRRPAGNGQGPSRENKYPRPGGAVRPRFRKNLPTPTTPAAKKPLRKTTTGQASPTCSKLAGRLQFLLNNGTALLSTLKFFPG